MRYFHRMPPLLRVASILALLFYLVSGGLLGPLLMRGLSTFSQMMSQSTVPQMPVDFLRVLVIGGNLSMLGLACTFALIAYNTRLRWPDTRPLLLDSWQSQVRAIVLPSALPLCAITLALVTPQTLPVAAVLIVVASAVSVLAVLVLLAAHFWVLVKYAVR
ncbi:MAG: hypothetical protein ACXWQR_09105 [Ktedonobacterales bacterium]